jgi:uncharacterized membrane protein
MKWIRNTFLQGLALVIPASVTIYVVYWLASGAESVLGGALRRMLPESAYVRGMGIVIALAGVFLVGLLMKLWALRKLVGLGEWVVKKLPLVKTLYGSMQDLMTFFSHPGEEGLEQVVSVEVPGTGMSLLGIVTREDFEDVPDGVTDRDDTIAVYLPMSYQIGGYMIIVPRPAVRPVDMSVEDGMRFAVTAGLSSARKVKPSGPKESSDSS